MPKKHIDYSKMIIYKICCKDLNITDLYIGHTTNLVQRRCSHKTSCNNERNKCYNFKVYKYIRDNGGWDNWAVIEVDKCPCLDFEEASKIEREYIESLNATLNTCIPLRTIKEYCKDNNEKINEQKKMYRENNKDKIYEQKKLYRENNKEKINECMRKWYDENKEYNKEYYKEKNKKYYEVNKEKIKEQKKHYYEVNKHLRVMGKVNLVNVV
jgi:hypothetical protein